MRVSGKGNFVSVNYCRRFFFSLLCHLKCRRLLLRNSIHINSSNPKNSQHKSIFACKCVSVNWTRIYCCLLFWYDIYTRSILQENDQKSSSMHFLLLKPQIWKRFLHFPQVKLYSSVDGYWKISSRSFIILYWLCRVVAVITRNSVKFYRLIKTKYTFLPRHLYRMCGIIYTITHTHTRYISNN